MRIGEVLKLTPGDIDDRKLIIQNPKSGRAQEVVYIPRKLLQQLKGYVEKQGLKLSERIFPISYVAAWTMVKKPVTWLASNCVPMISDSMRQPTLHGQGRQLKFSAK